MNIILFFVILNICVYFLFLNRSKSLNQYFVDLTATATETSLAKKEEDLEMRQTLRLGLEERSAAKLVERAKWIGGGVVRNLIELSLIVVSIQAKERHANGAL